LPESQAIHPTLTKDESQPPFEYACHEGNYGMPNILSGARKAEENPATGGLLGASPSGGRNSEEGGR
jgi:hypothetical protein